MQRVTINIDQVVKGLNNDKEKSKKALKRIVSDMRTRGPGWVSKAVREEYNIKTGDVKAAMHTEKGKGISFGGEVIDDVALVYKGRVLSLTHFSLSPKSRPKRKKYKIKTEIKKGYKKELGKNSFLAHTHGAGSKSIVFHRDYNASRLPIYAVKTLSIPQMVQDGNGNLKPSVEKTVNENLEKRFKHHMDQMMRT